METKEAALDFSRIQPDVRKKLAKLTKIDNYHASTAVAGDFAVIAASVAACLTISWWLYPIAVILIGSTQRAMVNILHEASHKVLARNGWLNLMLGTVFSGYLVFHLYNPYRNSHIGYHHRFLGDPEKDLDYTFHVECGLYDHTQSNRTFFMKNLVFALFGLRTLQYLGYIVHGRIFCRMPKLQVSMPIKFRTERYILLLEWVAIVGVCAAFGWLHLLLLFWFVPMFTAAVAIGWLSELAEHYPLPESETSQVLLTRNRHGMWLENYLCGRHLDRFHLVHHLNTGIPFWNMRKAHEILLEDPAYRRWDGMWGGILTRARDRRDRETVASYAAKYRDWRFAGGDPREAERSFAELMAQGTTPQRFILRYSD